MFSLCQKCISINPHIKENFIFHWDKQGGKKETTIAAKISPIKQSRVQEELY